MPFADQANEGRPLTGVGEYGLHVLLQAMLNVDGMRNVGDDCAVYGLAGGEVLLVNVDRLASNVEEYNRARLCVAQTLSDIICMGGTPEMFLVALTLPRDTSLSGFRALMSALRQELASHGVTLVGGDTKEGPAFHMVGVGLGRARAAQLVRRVGARPGMMIGVTSTAGRRWGLRWANAVIRELGLAVPERLAAQCSAADRVIQLPKEESMAAISTGYVRAGLDLSDGIGGGLRILARESGVGLQIDRTHLQRLVDPRLMPLASALGLPIECFALSPGYDWENMYVVEEQGLAAVIDAVASAGGGFSVIGRVTSPPEIRIDGMAVGVGDLPADEKFASGYAWEDRFGAWRDGCMAILGGML